MAFLQEYEKLRLIGKGAFASVYKVRHTELGYVRALKVSHEDIEGKNDKAWKTFLEECKMLLRIGNGAHPNIVRIYQPRLLDNKAAVEMDYVDGITLSEYVSQQRFLPLSEFKVFARQIVGALAYCHADIYRFMMEAESDKLEPDPNDGRKFLIIPEKEQELIAKYSIIHNDLHSNNIIRRDYDGQYILLDFGLSIQDNHCVKSSSRGDGAIEYTAPEKLEQNLVSNQSDVYALGILMYEFLTGRVPFQCKGNTPESARAKVYMQHLNETPPDIYELRRQAYDAVDPANDFNVNWTDLPEGLVGIVMKCLEKDPAKRFASAKELQIALEECFAQMADAEKPIQTKPEPPAAPVNTDTGLTESLLSEIKQLRADFQTMHNDLATKIGKLEKVEYKEAPITLPNDVVTPPPAPISKGRKFLINFLYCIASLITMIIGYGTYNSVSYYAQDEVIGWMLCAAFCALIPWVFKPKWQFLNICFIIVWSGACLIGFDYMDSGYIPAALIFLAAGALVQLIIHKLRYKKQ